MKRFLLLCISFIAFLAAPLLHTVKAEEPSDHGTALPEILILNSYHHGYAWSDDEQAGIIDVLRAKDKNWVPVVEYLDLKRLPEGRHLPELKKLFRFKYQNKKFSVVIAMDNPALEFAVNNQEELFRNAPIVFCGINNYTPSLLKGRSEVTGLAETIDIAGTIEVMLRLHPATREIFVPHDYTVTGLALRKETESLIPRFGAKVRFRFTDPLTMEELLKELERLPGDSLVLPMSFITDKSGRTFDISETTKLFSEHSPVPVYSTYEQRLGFGILGGKLLGGRHHGTHAARIALRILAGEKASAIPVFSEGDSQFMFDYKVMNRFGIPLSALPEGSMVINKPISIYAAHRMVILTALSVIVFLAAVIFLLLINIIQRRRSVEVTRRSGELFKVIASSTPDHLTVQDKDLRYSFVMNPQLGLTEQDMIGKTDDDFLSKEDADKLTEIKRQVLKTGLPVHVEVPLASLQGEQQLFDGSYVPKFDAKGQVNGLIGYFRNITERRRAEEALKISEVLFRELYDNMKSGSAIFTVMNDGSKGSDYIIKEMNRTGLIMEGKALEEVVGKRVIDIRPTIDSYGLIPVMKKVWETGESAILPVKIYIDEHYSNYYENYIFKLPSGEVVTLYNDVTESKRAEEALRESEERYRTLFNRAVDGIFILSVDCQLVEVNESLARMHGYSTQEMLNMNLKDLHTPETSQRAPERMRRVLAGEALTFDVEHYHKDGHVFPLEVSVSLISSGREPFIQCFHRDITGRKQAEEALRRTEANFRRFLEESPLGVRVVTAEGETIYANRAILDIYGCDSMEELNATPVKKRYTPESYAEFRIRREKRKRGEYGPSEYAVSIVRKDGEVRHLHVVRKEILWDGERQFQVMYNDITERKEAELKLIQWQNLMHFIIKHDPNAIAVYDDSLRYIFVSERYLTDYNVKEEDIIGKHHYEVFPEMPERWKMVHRRVLGGAIERAEEDYFERLDGSIDYNRWECRPWYNPDGTVGGMITYTEVITERKRAEKALKESESKYRNLIDQAWDAILVVDSTGKMLMVNEQACLMLGYTQEELMRLNIADTYSAEEQATIAQRIETVQRGVPLRYERSMVRKDGTTVPVEVTVGMTASGMIQGIVRNIAERKQAEEALRRTEENFRLSLDDSPLGVRIVTVESNTVYANRAMLNMYGYDSIEELKTTPLKERCTPESYAEYQIRKEKRKREGDRPSEYEISIVRKNGEVRHLQAFRKGISWNGEEQFQVIYQDITERRQAEEALQASREQLRALAERLQAVREEERTQIAREIHDELGGALTGLKIDFSFLTRAALKIENETVRTSLIANTDSMIKSIDATIHTVRRIAMELRPGVLDDLGLVAALEWQLKDYEKRTGIRCEFFPPGEDISLGADLSTALFRIFQEALTNVARHSGATEVYVLLRVDADSTTLEVEDNGKGIEKEKTMSSKSLGLLGMRERAQMFGGRVTVTGTPGIGTTVTVDIPPGESEKEIGIKEETPDDQSNYRR